MKSETPEQRLVRYLTRSDYETVVQATQTYTSTLSRKSVPNINHVKKILEQHGWTLREYIRELNQRA